MSTEPEILFDSVDGIGFIRLNRPKALNALSHDMCRRLDERLSAWERDPDVSAVVIEGTGDRAFCAGGDIRALYESAKAHTSLCREFFADEYRMNARLFHFPKPYIALIDGIVMGGGVGVSVHGSHRVAGDRTLFAMPETGIGMLPDVGGTYFLPRLPGKLGHYLGLTGARLKAADSVHAGVATHYVPSDRHADLKQALRKAKITSHDDVDEILARFALDPGPTPIDAVRERIDTAFAHPTVEAILDALEELGDDFSTETRDVILSKSPTSLKLVMRQLAEGAKLDFDECMKLEYRVVWRIMDGHDFFEGVRAVILDKDNAPKWKPATLAEVSDEEIARYFEPLGRNELEL